MDDNNPGEKKTVDVEIDPLETTLYDLLEIAEAHHAGTITIRGEMEDGTVQWGVVVTCGDGANEMMEGVQVTVDGIMASWRTSKMN